MAQDDEEDYMAVLEQKKKEVAAVQAAAQIARESALALLQTQRRIAEIDELAFGDGAGAGEESPTYAGAGAGADSGCSASQPSLAAAACAAGGDNGAGVGLSAHQHPLVEVRIDEDWICDGCGARSIDPGNEALPRFQCTAGCDFDLCGRCHMPRPQRPAAPPVVTRVYFSPNDEGSCLSPEDRRRFGLDADGGLPPEASGPSTAGAPSSSPPRGAYVSEAPSASSSRRPHGGGCGGGGGGGAPAASVPAQGFGASSGGGFGESAPQSVLTEEDRKRFGLDGPLSPEVSARVTAMMPAIAKLGQPGQKFDGTGGAAGSPEQMFGSVSGAGGSMRRTLEQLQAVGLTHLLPQLEETERQLQYLKLED